MLKKISGVKSFILFSAKPRWHAKNGGTAPCIHNFGTTTRGVITFMLRPFYPMERIPECPRTIDKLNTAEREECLRSSRGI